MYDPQLSRSTSSAKRLISSQLALEFPLLPPTRSLTSSAKPASGTPSLSRHSRSAQALALFRLPSLVMNHVPGSTWTMRVVSVQRDVHRAGPGAVWTAELEWTLECAVRVPVAGERRFVQKALRVVELEFEETNHIEEEMETEGSHEVGLAGREPGPGGSDRALSSGSSSSQEHTKHSSWGSLPSSRDPEVVLTKVK